jgi:HAD superfamily hydrolase (TIGR01509 family)
MTHYQHISLKNIKGILLHLDNTLYVFEPCHKAGYNACKKAAKDKYGIDSKTFDSGWEFGRNKVHKDLAGQGASHSRLLYLQKLYEKIFGKTNPEFTLEMEEIYWITYLKTMKLKPGMEAFLKRVKEENISVCLVTNLTAREQMRKWIQLDLSMYVDFLVTSEEAGVEKPEAAIFQLAIEKMGLNNKEVIMIGDSMVKDIRGAINLGMKAYWVK